MTNEERQRFTEEMEQEVAGLHHYIKHGKYPERTTPMTKPDDSVATIDPVVQKTLEILQLDTKNLAIQEVTISLKPYDIVRVHVVVCPTQEQVGRINDLYQQELARIAVEVEHRNLNLPKHRPLTDK